MAIVDVVSQLPLLEYDGLTAPCDSAPFQGGHVQAPREFPYIDGDGHDNVRRKSYTTTVTLYFIEGVEEGSFTRKWPVWRERLEDGSAGDLRHPLLGNFRARVNSWSGELTAQNRGGIVVTVEFVETNEDVTEPQEFTVDDIALSVVAAEAEAGAAEFDVNYPDGAANPTLGETIAGIEGSIQALGQDLSGDLNAAIGNVEIMIGQLENIASGNAFAYAALDNMIAVHSKLTGLKEKAAAEARPTASVTLTADTTIDGFAAEVGNTTDEIRGLNLAALKSPIVSKGSTLRYYLA